MSWINGRSLSGYENTAKNLFISYQYNADGIRTLKLVNGVETKYYLENSNIIFEQRGNDIIHYLYDGIGLLGLKYNDNTYYYIKNLKEDIIGVLDSTYNQVVFYEYDSWGKVLSIKDNQGNEITDTTNIGIINPFRYRGYYYDTETELYYLNSRYYNPEWGRLINADGTICADKNILSNNIYIYSGNNSVMNIDPTGKGFFTTLFVTLVAAVTVKNVNLYDTYDFTEFRTSLTVGALANDLGFVMQHTGLLIPYDWDVNYDMIYTEN